ncbi:CCKAR protein, partial [Sylvia borin]|nr:CCKAR protein [Sylvia borin]
GALLPTELDVAVRVVLYVLIFVLSVGGNALVVAVLALNRRLRTVTNCFLLSLALSDLLLALCCMPFTLLPSLMGAFIFGDVVCKLVAYLMVVCSSVISRFPGDLLVALGCSMSPWCHGHFRVPCTPSHPPGGGSHGVGVQRVPTGAMAVTMPPHSTAQRGIGGDPAPACDEGDGCYLQLSRPGAALELRALGAAVQQDRARINSSGAQLAAKRRVIRMLVVIVAMFFLCWLPIFAANTWRAFAPRAAQRALSGTPIAFIHLLSYTSACANPLIYCFMNRRFRKAF